MLIKRVVALAGETVEFRDGRCLVDGVPLDEPYVRFPCDWNAPPKLVPPGHLYVVGDNRSMPQETHVSGVIDARRAGLKAKALGELVDGKLHLVLPELGYNAEFDAREVQQQAAYARNQMGNLHVEFQQIEVTFPASGEASATADALVTGDLDGFRGREVRAVRARLRKDPETKKWRFRDVRLDPVLVQ